MSEKARAFEILEGRATGSIQAALPLLGVDIYFAAYCGPSLEHALTFSRSVASIHLTKMRTMHPTQ